jgi:hypothetical protein
MQARDHVRCWPPGRQEANAEAAVDTTNGRVRPDSDDQAGRVFFALPGL